jgi:peptide deformylase
MAILPIISWPDKRLKDKSVAVTKFDAELDKFLDDMMDTMHQADGIGLAAIQVAVAKRVITIDIGSSNNRYPETQQHVEVKPLSLVNPEIIKKSDVLNTYNEGCLSFPGVFATVTRPEAITIKYQDKKGKEHMLSADGLLATCIQHEIDHLNGITFVDKLTKLKRDMVLKKYKKIHSE